MVAKSGCIRPRKRRALRVLSCAAAASPLLCAPSTLACEELLACRFFRPPDEHDVSSDNLFSRDAEPCTPNVEGLFGFANLTVEEPLYFYYQLETKPLEDLGGVDYVNSDVLPTVETEVSKVLLPELFANECAAVARSSRAREPHAVRRMAEVLGISTTPADLPLEDVECELEMEDEENDCYFIDGTMTLYSESEMEETLLDRIRELIRAAMDSGTFDNVGPNVVRLRFVDTAPETYADDDWTTGSTGAETIDEGIPGYAWALIAIGTAGSIILAFVLLSRRDRRNQDEADCSYENAGALEVDSSGDDEDVYHDDDDQALSVSQTTTIMGQQRARSSEVAESHA